MLVASNTSPICSLAIIGRLDLLRVQFHKILIPGAVRTELDRLSHPEASRAIDAVEGPPAGEDTDYRGPQSRNLDDDWE